MSRTIPTRKSITVSIPNTRGTPWTMGSSFLSRNMEVSNHLLPHWDSFNAVMSPHQADDNLWQSSNISSQIAHVPILEAPTGGCLGPLGMYSVATPLPVTSWDNGMGSDCLPTLVMNSYPLEMGAMVKDRGYPDSCLGIPLSNTAATLESTASDKSSWRWGSPRRDRHDRSGPRRNRWLHYQNTRRQQGQSHQTTSFDNQLNCRGDITMKIVGNDENLGIGCVEREDGCSIAYVGGGVCPVAPWDSARNRDDVSVRGGPVFFPSYPQEDHDVLVGRNHERLHPFRSGKTRDGLQSCLSWRNSPETFGGGCFQDHNVDPGFPGKLLQATKLEDPVSPEYCQSPCQQEARFKRTGGKRVPVNNSTAPSLDTLFDLLRVCRRPSQQNGFWQQQPPRKPSASRPVEDQQQVDIVSGVNGDSAIRTHDVFSPHPEIEASPSGMMCTTEVAVESVLDPPPGVLEEYSPVAVAAGEILDTLEKAVTPTEKENQSKSSLFNAMCSVIHMLNPQWSLFVAGSTAYDGALAGGDIDTVLFVPPQRGKLAIPLEILGAVESVIGNHSLRGPLCGAKLSCFPSAKVPILSVESMAGPVLDLSVNSTNSIRHTLFFKSILKEHPSIRPFMRLLKYWTAMRSLPDMKEGGFPNILWTSLAACILLGETSELRPISPCLPGHSKMNLFIAARTFFSFLSSRKRLSLVISLSTQTVLMRRCEMHRGKIIRCGAWDPLLVVEDPADVPYTEYGIPSANLSLKCFKPRFINEYAEEDEPGRFQIRGEDLANRISAATWIVYLYELSRAANIFRSLDEEMADDASARSKISLLVLSVFQAHASPNIYRLPLHPRGSLSKPFLFALMLAGGGLHAVRIDRICSTNMHWWMRTHLSRRDYHSHIHTTLCVLRRIKEGPLRDSIIVETVNRNELLYVEDDQDTVVSGRTDIRMIFHPVHFVCLLQLSETAEASADGKSLTILEEGEVLHLARLIEIVKEAPYYYQRCDAQKSDDLGKHWRGERGHEMNSGKPDLTNCIQSKLSDDCANSSTSVGNAFNSRVASSSALASVSSATISSVSGPCEVLSSPQDPQPYTSYSETITSPGDGLVEYEEAESVSVHTLSDDVGTSLSDDARAMHVDTTIPAQSKQGTSKRKAIRHREGLRSMRLSPQQSGTKQYETSGLDVEKRSTSETKELEHYGSSKVQPLPLICSSCGGCGSPAMPIVLEEAYESLFEIRQQHDTSSGEALSSPVGVVTRHTASAGNDDTLQSKKRGPLPSGEHGLVDSLEDDHSFRASIECVHGKDSIVKKASQRVDCNSENDATVGEDSLSQAYGNTSRTQTSSVRLNEKAATREDWEATLSVATDDSRKDVEEELEKDNSAMSGELSGKTSSLCSARNTSDDTEIGTPSSSTVNTSSSITYESSLFDDDEDDVGPLKPQMHVEALALPCGSVQWNEECDVSAQQESESASVASNETQIRKAAQTGVSRLLASAEQVRQTPPDRDAVLSSSPTVGGGQKFAVTAYTPRTYCCGSKEKLTKIVTCSSYLTQDGVSNMLKLSSKVVDSTQPPYEDEKLHRRDGCLTNG